MMPPNAGCQGCVPSVQYGRALGAAAGVVVFDDCHSSAVEVRYKLKGSLDVQHVVVGNLLAVQLLGEGTLRSVEHGFLVGVLSIAQMGGAGLAGSECRYLFPAVEVLENVGVISGTLEEGFGGEAAAVLNGGDSLFSAEQLQQVSVGVLAGDNDYVTEVLCGSAYEGDAAYVNLFDYLFFRGVFGDIFFERVEVHDHEVDARNLIFLLLRQVRCLFPAEEYTAHDFRMKGLHSASEDGRVSGHVLDGCNRNVMGCQIVLGTPGGEYLHT